MTKAWPGPITAITLFTEDLPATKAFYERVFGLPAHYEDEDSCVFLFGTTMINLLKVEQAPDLISPAEVAAKGPARFQFTLSVEDVDAMCSELRARGVALLNGPMDRPWGIRTASFEDPAGNIWEIAK